MSYVDIARLPWVHDAELILIGKAMLVTLIGDEGDCYLFAGLFLDW